MSTWHARTSSASASTIVLTAWGSAARSAAAIGESAISVMGLHNGTGLKLSYTRNTRPAHATGGTRQAATCGERARRREQASGRTWGGTAQRGSVLRAACTAWCRFYGAEGSAEFLQSSTRVEVRRV